MDPRVGRMAKLLVNYSAQIMQGDRVLIEAEPIAEPLVRALFEGILENGGHPHLFISLSGQETLTGLDDVFIAKADSSQLDHPATFYELVYKQFDARFRVHSLSNTRTLTNFDPKRMAHRKRATATVLENQFTRGWKGEFRWVTTLFPTNAYAQEAEMSLEEYEGFVFGACHVSDPEQDPVEHWQSVEAKQKQLVDRFAGHDQIVVQSPTCDLTLSIKDRVFIDASGRRNMPDGEIFTGPVEESVNGWIHFNFPAVYRGVEVAGVKLRFENGKVVEASAEKNQTFLDEMLATDPGSRFLGEFAIGTNMGIQKHTKNILFDEKIGGTIHMALGAGYPMTGSKNKSAIHWDLIYDMRGESVIKLDGDLVYRDGAFLT
ncbi:MAG: aminopeptidase [Anaerolineales bacterium]|nr:aminopeptidase [Anaerolineales bacterium]